MGQDAPRRTDHNDPGHAHELTFSVYRRAKLFLDPELCREFLANLDRARKRLAFEVWAYVVMPDHVHLLVWPTQELYDMAAVRKLVKQPFSRAVLAQFEERGDTRLARLTLGEERHFWQPGKGYDRNIHSVAACKKTIDYIHNNPVAGRLVKLPWDYPWSSARWYADRYPVEFEVDRAKY